MSIENETFDGNIKRIKQVLTYANKTKYYSSILNDVNIENITYEDFSQIPVLEKNDLKNNITDMISPDFVDLDICFFNKLQYHQKKAYLEANNLELRITSGSTGNPIEVIKSKADIKRDYISLNFYRRKLTTYKFTGKFLWIWPINPYTKKSFYPQLEENKIWHVNRYGDQYMMYSYCERDLYDLYTYIIENKIEWITTSPSAIINLLNFMDSNGYKIDSIKYVECHSEFLQSWQKEKISSALNCQVTSIYSSNEVQFMGGLCVYNHMHLFDNACFMEFLPNKYGGKTIYVTSLNNLDVPIIRYRLGDCGEWSKEQHCDILPGNPRFELKQYRENDHVIGINNDRYEPFIITDSIAFIKDFFNLDIQFYRVVQNDVNKFTYFFDRKFQFFDKNACEVFLGNYLKQILGYEVTVSIQNVDVKKLINECSKYKYFECNCK